jgi:site-specific DNA-methyltransferase (adenine-specific)
VTTARSTSRAPFFASDDVTLYLGDMRQILPELGLQADLVLADPPYEQTRLVWDLWPGGWLDAVASASTSMWCWLPIRQFAAPPFRGQEFAAAGWTLSHDIEAEWDHVVWEKHNGSHFATDRFRRVHEVATHWYRGRWGDVHHEVPRVPHDGPWRGTRRAARAGSFLGRNNGHDRPWQDDGTRLLRSVFHAHSMKGVGIHPTEKPVSVLQPLIEYACPPNGLVLDPFAGSGSGAAAARLSGRRAVLIEADERYCELIARRLQQELLPLGDLSGRGSSGEAS